MPSDEFERLVGLLNHYPDQPCVIREQFLDDLGISPDSLAAASGRKFDRVPEFQNLPERNMTLRDFVFSFSAKESA